MLARYVHRTECNSWSRGLGKYYEDLIISSTTTELIHEGYLCGFVAFAPSDPDLSNVPMVAGDFHQGELAVAMDKPVLVGDIIETWFKLGENRQTFCFCVNRHHAKHITERFLEAGVAAEYMDGATRESREPQSLTGTGQGRPASSATLEC